MLTDNDERLLLEGQSEYPKLTAAPTLLYAPALLQAALFPPDF